MKTYTFKPEFEEKLKRFRIKEKFIRNIKEQVGQGWIKRCKIIDTEPDWYNFILGAFIWVSTPEGQYFWSKIADHD